MQLLQFDTRPFNKTIQYALVLRKLFVVDYLSTMTSLNQYFKYFVYAGV